MFFRFSDFVRSYPSEEGRLQGVEEKAPPNIHPCQIFYHPLLENAILSGNRKVKLVCARLVYRKGLGWGGLAYLAGHAGKREGW